MSANGLEVFDRTLEITHIWLNEIMEEIAPDRQVAWKVLSIVLHKLRDRLPIGLAVHLGAQLPMLVRGVYYDQFEPGKLPVECDTRDEFIAEVEEWLADTRPVDPEKAVRTVFGVLARHISQGQIDNVVHSLPQQLRELWPDNTQTRVEQRQQQAGVGPQGENSPGGNSAFFGNKDQAETEPASPNAQQQMVGGTDGSGPAR